MNSKSFALTSSLLFLAIAVLHALRIAYGWSAVIGGWAVPMWFSWLAIIATAYLAYAGLRLAK